MYDIISTFYLKGEGDKLHHEPLLQDGQVLAVEDLFSVAGSLD